MHYRTGTDLAQGVGVGGFLLEGEAVRVSGWAPPSDRGLSPGHILEREGESSPSVDMPEALEVTLGPPSYKMLWAEGGSLARVDCVPGADGKPQQVVSYISEPRRPYVKDPEAFRRLKREARAMAQAEGDPSLYEGCLTVLCQQWAEQQEAAGERKKRGRVYGFSAGSRKRLQRRLNSVNRVRWPRERVLFIGLTYPGKPSEALPDVWPRDPEAWKKHLEALHDAWEAEWGADFPVIWKLEFQTRKSGVCEGQDAPHFHLLAFVPLRYSCDYVWLLKFRSWLSEAWFRVVGSGDPDHLKAGASCKQVASWRGVVSYAAKYLGKAVEVPIGPDGQPLPVGRFWGCWRLDALGIRFAERALTSRGAYAVRRAIRGLLKADARDRGKEVRSGALARGHRKWGSSYSLVSCEVAERLAEWGTGFAAAPLGALAEQASLRWWRAA